MNPSLLRALPRRKERSAPDGCGSSSPSVQACALDSGLPATQARDPGAHLEPRAPTHLLQREASSQVPRTPSSSRSEFEAQEENEDSLELVAMFVGCSGVRHPPGTWKRGRRAVGDATKNTDKDQSGRTRGSLGGRSPVTPPPRAAQPPSC